MSSVSVCLSFDELWLLQGVVRHEMAQGETWKFPPASKELNDQIANALLFCEDTGTPEAFLELTKGDCYVIDYLVPNTAKSASGSPVGKNILMKSFRARAALDGWFSVTAQEPVVGSVKESLAEWENTDQKIHSRIRRNRKHA